MFLIHFVADMLQPLHDSDNAGKGGKEAVKITYGTLPKTEKGKPATITAEYEAKADPVIRLQIEKAGARLTRVLNESLR
jgi:hypothetical protein